MRANVLSWVIVAGTVAVTSSMFLTLAGPQPSIMGSMAITTVNLPSLVPSQINHQGIISVDGIRFDGEGRFRFAILDPISGQNVWTNDGTQVPGPGMPQAAVAVAVFDGLYSVPLGDTSVTNMFRAIPATVFRNPNLALRIWFDDERGNGVQQLIPDQKLTAVPYALQAQFQPPIGSIIAWHKNMPNTPGLPDGWAECNGQILSDLTSPYHGHVVPNLNASEGQYFGGRFLRGGTLSGTMQEGTLHFNDWDSAAGGTAIPWIGTNGLIDPDGNIGQCVNDEVVAPGIGQAPCVQNYSYSRPINMSVVWIMRVK